MNEDAELLRRYAAHDSESAFAEFVQRRVDFVYGCALRRVGGDAHFAEDVTQQVFIAAAREAARLADHPVIAGWLFTATRNAACQLVRSERRRQAREKEAQAMNDREKPQATVDWERLRPVLDHALDSLGEIDRRAVLLRFFEGRSFGDVGAQLHLAENAARMRVNRAVEKLSGMLQRHGVTSTAAALAVALANQPAVAVPTGLAAAATGAALAGGGAATVGSAVAVFMGMTKLQLGLAGAMIVAGATGVLYQGRALAALQAEQGGTEQTLAQNAFVAADNARLRRQSAEAEELSRARTGELLALEQRADALRQRVAAVETVRAEAPRTTKVYDLRDLTKQPKATNRVAPHYPSALRRLGLSGEATIDFVVDAHGNVQNATAIRATLPELAAAAVDAVARWKFEPGQKDGAAVGTHMQVPIVFTLNETPTKPDARNAPWF